MTSKPKIRFKAIKNFFKKHYNAEMEIYLTTKSMPQIAASKIVNNKIEVVINGNICKNEYQVLIACCHEFTHIFHEKHDTRFQLTLLKIISDACKYLNLDYTKAYNTLQELDRLANITYNEN